MTAPLSVIIPLYNSGATVAQTLASVLDQSFADFRVIVVNDGSTDSGPAIVENFARSDERISMVTRPNGGLAAARNTGLEIALQSKADFVHFLDADDWMTPRAYEHLLPAAAETGASYGGYELRDADGRALNRQSPMSTPIVGFDEQIEWNRAATHALLFRTDLLRDLRFDESLPCVEDYDLWLRLASSGIRWKGVERIVAAYRLRPDSMSKKFASMAATYEMVLRRNVAAARPDWAAKIDLSERRLIRVLGAMNLCYATMSALVDPLPNKARAAALLDDRTHPSAFTPAQAAQAASTALLFGACTAPDLDGWSERRWLVALRQWWVRCAEEGWLTFDDIEPAFDELSRKVVHPDAIASSMLDESARRGHAREHGVVVVGLDRQGRRLARLAASRAWRVLILDDFSDRREAECLEPITGVHVVRIPQDFPGKVADGFAGAPWLAGAQDADPLLRSIAANATTRPALSLTWSDHRDRIGAEYLRRIRAALATPRAMAG